MNHNYFVYILRCADDKYYVGVTNNVERRVQEHEDGVDLNCFTYTRRPVLLVYVERHQYIQHAIDREKQLKGWGRRKKEALIAGDEAALSFHALGYERRVFPPLPHQKTRKTVIGSASSP
jgi:putative endonuclease